MAQHNIGHFEKVRALACGARVLVLGGVRDGGASQITFYDAVSHKRVAAASVPAHVLGLTLAGELAVAACSDGKLRVYKAGTGEFVRDIAAHDAAVNSVAALSDGARVVSAGADGRLRLFAVSSGERKGDWSLSTLPLRVAAADPTGEYVAGAGDDGVVRVVTLAGGALREMPGHDGPVLSLAFTPRDGRLVSGGDDGLLRIWFLAGDVECEIRGKDDAGHQGGVNALMFLPQPKLKAGAEDPGDRFVSAGADGKVKFWRLEDRRKPRSLDVQGENAAFALAFARITKGDQFGLVFVGGDHRSVDVISVDTAGTPGDQSRYGHGFQALHDALSGARPAREAAVRELAAQDEPEALDMVVRALKSDRYHEVQELAARELGNYKRLKARPALREALDANQAPVRGAAYESLLKLEGTGSPAAARAALASRHADLRVRALQDLAALKGTSPLIAGLLAGCFTDKLEPVRLAALDAYSSLFEEGSVEPLQTAFERGPAELRSEALVRAALGHKLSHPKLDPVVSRALDDENPAVRRTAFVLKVLERPALAARLSARDEDFQRAVREVSRHAASVLGGSQARSEGKAPGDDAVAQARTQLGASAPADAPLDEEGLSPLLAAMACRTPDTALRGARGLAELGDTRALGALLQLSRESDHQIRREAAAALRALSDPRAKKRLIWMLDDANADVRTAAFDAYGRLEKDTLELAEAALRSSQKDIRVQGLNLLVKQGDKRSATTTALLEDALEDESDDVRSEAFRTLWSWHSKDPEQALRRALQGRFATLRQRAVTELETLGKDASWARDLLLTTVSDRSDAVALAAFNASVKLRGKEDSAAPLAAMASAHGNVRAAGAEAARHAPVEAVRSALSKQLDDEHAEARSQALTSLDRLLPKEAGPLYAALQGGFYDLKVQAAEHLADRHDEQIIDAMRSFLSDKELAKKLPQSLASQLHTLRYRAAKALATLASPRLLKFFATELLKDDDGAVREQGARGLSLACRKGDEGFLLDALGHNDVAVRSWGAEGLAKLGDARALPVLTGHLRHEHPPVRVGATLAFAALGPEGYGGMLQGLEDPSREVQELVFQIVLARDLRAFRHKEQPDLLTSALSSQRAEIRYAAGRALELRGDPERYLHHLIEALLPAKPDKAAAMKNWPEEAERSRLMVALAEAIASDQPDLRYAASQALRLRDRPAEFFKQVEKITRLRGASQAVVADTTPRASTGEEVWGEKGWMRRLFRGSDGAAVNDQVPDAEQQRLRWLAFGGYVGLLRQATAGDDEGANVRRDAIERVVDLARQGFVSSTAALPPLGRALDDPNYLVRRAAFAGLKRLFPEGADEPLVMAMASHSGDVARAALDELAARGEAGRPAIARALNAPVGEVRKHAFELLEGLYPKGSLEPLMHALESDHADVRLGVLRKLAQSHDERVQGALVRALRSDHDDLRLLASELLARRKNDLAADVLGGFLRGENATAANSAREALIQLGSNAAVDVLAARLNEVTEEDARSELLDALARTRNVSALDAILPRFADENEEVRSAALQAALSLSAIDSRRRDWALAIRALRAAVQARDPALRRSAAGELEHGEEVGQSALLQGLFHDRDVETRKAAVESYSSRVRKRGAPVGPLEELVRKGARDTLLAASEGVAHAGNVAALRPLLLFSRAGEGAERPRALLALGLLGDSRALTELETIAAGGTEEAPVELDMRAAAIEALGRMHAKLTSAEAQQRIVERLEQSVVDSQDDLQKAALRGLRWLGGERARRRIEVALTSDETGWTTKVEAAKLLAEFKTIEAESALLIGLKDSDNDVRAASLKSLRKLFPNERTRVELHALLNDDSDIARPAATFLAREGDPELLLPKLGELSDDDLVQQLRLGLLRRPVVAATSLARLLARPEAEARANAAWLSGARADQVTASPDRAALVQALLASEAQTAASWEKSTDKRDVEERAWRNVVWALRALGAREALPRLRALLTAERRPAPVAREAAFALGELGGDDDIKALQAALLDADAGIRTTAAAGLRGLAHARALGMALQVKPHDPVSFAAAVEGPSEAALDSGDARRLALPRLLATHQGALVAPRLDKATGQDLLDLMAAAGRSGGTEAIEALKRIAFDKKKYEVAERKAAYRALRRAQRLAAKPQQETQA